MHSRLLILSSLFLLHIVEVARGAALSAQDSSSVYDKLVELTHTKKCTYLQKTPFFDKKSFLTNCSYEDALAADLENAYYLEKLHCLLYFDTFQDLCVTGKEEVVMAHISDPSIKAAGNESIQNICNAIQKFYTAHNESKVAMIMLNNKGCEKACTNLMGAGIEEACALSALMSNVKEPKVVANNSAPAANAANLSSNVNSKSQPGMQSEPLAKQDEEHMQKYQDPKTNSESNAKVPDQSLPKEPIKDKGQHQLDTANQPVNNSPAVNTSASINVNPVKDNPKGVSAGSTQQSNGQNSQESNTNNPNQKATDGAIATPEKGPGDSAGAKLPPSVTEAGNKPENSEAGRTNEELDNDAEEDSAPLDDPDESDKPANEKPPRTTEDEDFNRSVTNDDLPTNDSYFFSYFMMFCILFVMGYVGYHNKQKILALLLEGRRGRRQPRRRPNSANYHKLDSNLEEAVMSSCDKTTSNVIY